jgi:hypothetical protein
MVHHVAHTVENITHGARELVQLRLQATCFLIYSWATVKLDML